MQMVAVSFFWHVSAKKTNKQNKRGPQTQACDALKGSEGKNKKEGGTSGQDGQSILGCDAQAPPSSLSV